MRAVVIEDFGSADVMRFREVREPSPPPGGYVVHIVASAVNFADVVERQGLYRKTQALPSRLGKEASGIVVARADDADEFDIGDPVIVIRMSNGCYAERVPAEAHEVLRPPEGYSFLEMAAFGVAYGTAWFAMHEAARVRPGDSALIHAAAGGVGSAAVTLARTGGCDPVIGTAGGPDKCALVLDRGADACFDYEASDFRPGVLTLTDGEGADYCLESVGGEVYRRSLDVVAPLGRMVIIGFSSLRGTYAEDTPRLHPLTVFHRSFSVGGLNVDNISFTRHRRVWERLLAHVEEHRIRPLIGPVFPFEDIRMAHDMLEARRSTGKVMLVVDDLAGTVPSVPGPSTLELASRPAGRFDHEEVLHGG